MTRYPPALIIAGILLTTLVATGAYASGPLGFAGVSLGATEGRLLTVFPDADCRGDRCSVDAVAWGLPTRAWFIFNDDGHPRSVKSIALAFKSEYYGQVLPRLVLEFGQPTE